MGKTIRDLMTDNPCSIDADKPVAYAAKMMRDEDVGLAPIVEGEKLIGTLTDRDIAIRVVAEGKDPQSTTVREVATTRLVTVDPDQNLDEALRLMAKNQVRRLPVVEEDGKLAGVVAQADVARHASDQQTGEVVEEISKVRRGHARQERQRQEREAVREAQGQGNVEVARGEDRELARRIEPRRQELRVGLVAQQLVAGRHHRSEKGGGTQGRSRDRA